MASWFREIKAFCATLSVIASVFLGLSGFFLVLGVVALDEVMAGRALELYKLGNVPIPKFLGAGASNIEMLIFCVAAAIAIGVALIRRYVWLRDERNIMRRHGVREADLKRENNGFTDEMFDGDDPQ